MLGTACEKNKSKTCEPKGTHTHSELHRTKPDVVVFCPTGSNDTDNEHFLVFKAPKSDSLLAMWTQSSCEGYGDNKIVLSRSTDGVNWSSPKVIAGHRLHDGKTLQSSWAVPIVNSKGRIYCIYLKEEVFVDMNRSTSGSMGCIVSDDDGHTWQEGGTIEMPRDKFDHPDDKYPKNWISWQLPIRDSKGRIFLGYTQWSSPQIYGEPPAGWYSRDSRCKFMCFENIDSSPAVKDLKITFLPDDVNGLAVNYPNRPDVSVAQEPSVVLLPDNRLFCVMRTFTGFIWYSVSSDDGYSWRKPEMLRDKDNGEPIRQPIAPCPIYSIGDKKYMLLFHNNDGHLANYRPVDVLYNRRPAHIAVGAYVEGAYQPIWFEKPKQILDTDGITVGPKGTSEVATYTSLTQWHGKTVLWYPDRKYFLLGKYLGQDLIG